MKPISACVALAALMCAASVEAAPVLNLLPPGGAVTAAPGETVGWGYEIVNDDADHWLVVSSLSSGGFQFGTGSDLVFDFPILAPGTSLLRPYVPGAQGLYEFTWDLSAPGGFVNTGTFVIGAELWAGDPFVDGQFVSTLADFLADYSAATSSQPDPAPVPEPGTLLLLSAGFGLAGLQRRRARAKFPIAGPDSHR